MNRVLGLRFASAVRMLRVGVTFASANVAAERARVVGTKVMLDLDFRPDQWHDARAYGVTIRSALRLADIVIGTADETKAAALTDSAQVDVTHSQVSDAHVAGDAQQAAQAVLSAGPEALVMKAGAERTTVYLRSGEVIVAAPFPVSEIE